MSKKNSLITFFIVISLTMSGEQPPSNRKTDAERQLEYIQEALKQQKDKNRLLMKEVEQKLEQYELAPKSETGIE